jgi:rhodanese-related sulfurtransferase
MKLKIAVLVLAFGLAGAPARAEPQQPEAAKPGYSTVSGETFSRAPAGATLIDVREPSEWVQTGVPADARRVSISRNDFVEAVLAELGGDKSRPVAVICRSGARSQRAADQLVAAGFTNVTNVGDGMIGREGVGPGWLAAQLPLTRVDAGQ